MKATTLLKKDHAAVKKLFRAYERAEKADDNTLKQTIFAQIDAALEVHTWVEEEIFYPAMKAQGDEEGVEEVLEALEKHGVVKSLLAQLLLRRCARKVRFSAAKTENGARGATDQRARSRTAWGIHATTPEVRSAWPRPEISP